MNKFIIFIVFLFSCTNVIAQEKVFTLYPMSAHSRFKIKYEKLINEEWTRGFFAFANYGSTFKGGKIEPFYRYYFDGSYMKGTYLQMSIFGGYYKSKMVYSSDSLYSDIEKSMKYPILGIGLALGKQYKTFNGKFLMDFTIGFRFSKFPVDKNILVNGVTYKAWESIFDYFIVGPGSAQLGLGISLPSKWKSKNETQNHNNRFFFSLKANVTYNPGERAKSNSFGYIPTLTGLQKTELIPKHNSDYFFKPWKWFNPEPWFKLNKGNTGTCNCDYSSVGYLYSILFHFNMDYRNGIIFGLDFSRNTIKQYFFTTLPSFKHYMVEFTNFATGIPIYYKRGDLREQMYFYGGLKLNLNGSHKITEYVAGEVYKNTKPDDKMFKKSNILFAIGGNLGIFNMEINYMPITFLNRNYDNNGTSSLISQRNHKLYISLGANIPIGSGLFNNSNKEEIFSNVNFVEENYSKNKPTFKLSNKKKKGKYWSFSLNAYRSLRSKHDKEYPEECMKAVWTMPILNSSVFYNIDGSIFGVAIGLEHSNYGIRTIYDPFDPSSFIDENKVLALGIPISIKIGSLYFGGQYFWNYLHSRKQTFTVDDNVKKYLDVNSNMVNKFTPALFVGKKIGDFSVELDYFIDNFLSKQYRDPNGIEPFEYLPGHLLFLKLRYMLFP